MRRRSGQSDPLAVAATIRRRPDRDFVPPTYRQTDQRVLIWIADFEDREYFNYYGKNCCPAWQPPLGVAGVRNKYDWKAETFALSADYPWLSNELGRDAEFCVVETGKLRPNQDSIQESNSMGAPPFHALNQTEFYYLSDGDPVSTDGINRLNNPLGGSAQSFIRGFVIMSVGFFDFSLWAECRNELRSSEWRPFFNAYQLPKTSPCLIS